MNKAVMTIALSKISQTGKQYLAFSQNQFDEDGIAEGRKAGFLEISADTDEEANAILEKAKSRDWHFGAKIVRSLPSGETQVLFEVLKGVAPAISTTRSNELVTQA